MSVKSKIINAMTAHPKLVTLGIGLAITFVIGTSVGLVEHQAFAHPAIAMASHSS